MGPGPWTLLVTAGLSLGCRADTLPGFLMQAVLLHWDNLVHPLPFQALQSPDTSQAAPHVEKKQYNVILSWCRWFFEALQVQEKGRKETSQSGCGTPSTRHPAAAQGRCRPCPFPRKEIFLVRFLKGCAVPLSYGPRWLCRGQGQGASPPSHSPGATSGSPWDGNTSQPIPAPHPPGKGNSWLYCVTSIL